MDERLKKRLVGATVLTVLVVIFLPMLFEDKPDELSIDEAYLPPPPPPSFSNPILPSASEDLSKPPVALSSRLPMRSLPTRKPLPPAAEPDVHKATAPMPPVAASEDRQQERKPASPSAWVLQIASFSSQVNAQRLLQRLRKKHYPAFQIEARVKGKKVYRVRVGPEISRKQLEHMAVRIDKLFKLESRIIRYP